MRLARHAARVAAVGLVVLGTATTAVVAASPSAEAAAGSDRLTRGQALYPGQRLIRNTVNGTTVELDMQNDGNLVLYNDGGAGHGRRVCWASNTQFNGFYAIYQTDGNFVVYNHSLKPTWASHTQNDGGTTTDINQYGQVWAGWSAISSFCQ